MGYIQYVWGTVTSSALYISIISCILYFVTEDLSWIGTRAKYVEIKISIIIWYFKLAYIHFSHCHFYAPNFEEVDGAYWFRVVYPSLLSRTVHARVLNFQIWIPHGKIADAYFFLVRVISLSGVMPLWKKSQWNFVSKISRKVFELGAWNLVSW